MKFGACRSVTQHYALKVVTKACDACGIFDAICYLSLLKMSRWFACFSIPYRIHFRRIHIAFILFIVCCGLVVVLYFSGYGLVNSSSHFKKTLRVNYVKRVGNYSSACRLPYLDPFHPSILKFVKDLGKLQCKGDRYSSFINNLLEVKGEDIYSAQYRTIERPQGDDFKVILSDPTSLSNGAEAGNDKNSANTGENYFYTFSYVLY